MLPRRLVLSLVALVAITTGLRDRSAASPSRDTADRLAVAVSLPPQAWLVEAVGGDRVEIVTLLQPGASPETYQPSDAQVSRVLESRLLVRIGVPFENGAWFEALRAVKRLEVVDQRSGVELRDVADAGHPGTPRDPHIWLSPRRLEIQADTVAQALARLDPAHRADYEEGKRRVTAQLEELDEEIARELAPYRGRAVFVFHPSWGYFTDDYGLRQVAIEVGGREPNDRELTRLQSEARAAGARVIFVQPQIRSRAAKAVAAATGARVVELDPLARDVPSNLRSVAARMRESFAP